MASKAKFTDEELLEISNRVMGGLERTSVDLSPEEQRRQNMLNDPTGAGIPLLYNGQYEGTQPAGEQKPSVMDKFVETAGGVAENVAGAIRTVAGAPVDLATAATNVVGLTDLDPSQMPFGSESIRRFEEGTMGGLANAARGMSMTGKQTPEERTQQRALADESMAYSAGEMFGEITPFLAPATLIPKITSLIPRALMSGLLGGTEGAAITRGRGDDDVLFNAKLGTGLGVGFEIVAPIIGRVINGLVRRSGGVPKDVELVDDSLNATDELVAILDDLGLTVDDVQESVMKEIKGGADIEQAERVARFGRQGIPASRGQILQDEVMLGQEEMLMGRTDAAGELIAQPLRQTRDAASDAFIRNSEEMVDELGVPTEFGQRVKDALGGRKKLLRNEKNRLYQLAAESDEIMQNLPMMSQGMIDAIPDDAVLRRFARNKGSNVPAIRDLFVEFGFDQSDEAVKAFLKKDPKNEILNLSVGNIEEFRKALNASMRSDPSGSTAALINPFIKAYDKELDNVFKEANKNTDISLSSLKILKTARRKVRELKMEFDPKGEVEKLISMKSNGAIPTIDQSQVYKTISNLNFDALDRVMTSLNKASGGKRAIKDLQASVVMDALEKATSAVSNKGGGGKQLFSATVFVNQLNKLDAGGKLKKIFMDDPDMYKRLMDLKKTARDVVTPSSTKPKGSAPYVNELIGIIGSLRSLPLVKQVADITMTGRQVGRSMDLTPERRQISEYISREYPSLATVLGVGILSGDNEITREGNIL